MAEPAPFRNVLPNFRTPRLIGIFNVVFASELLICGLCFGSYLALLPLMARGMNQMQGQVVKQAESRKQSELADLAEKAKGAKTDAEKKEIEARRKEVEGRPKVVIPGMMDLNMMGLTAPKMMAWSWVEVGTGLGLNVLMLASGIGLLSYRGWARHLAVWTAALKIARLALVYAFFALAIVPGFSQNMGKMVGDMMVQQQQAMGAPAGGPPPGDMMAWTYTIMYSVWAVGTIVIGSIYPAVVVWTLTRPAVVAACSGRSKPPRERNEP